MATDRPVAGRPVLDILVRHVPPIKAVMTPFPHSVSIESPIGEARVIMAKLGVRHLPVKSASGILIGVVTDRDIKLVLGPYADAPPNTDIRVRTAVVPDAYSVDLETPLDRVVAHMAEHRIGCALVTKDGRLAGIFTTVDACRLLADSLGGTDGPGDEAA
jgi:acetoin utilization protein AcuB